MKINFKPLSWLILFIGFSVYICFALTTNHEHDPTIVSENFVKASFALITTLFIWTCVQILIKSFNMKHFSWVISITGYILAFTVFFYFGIAQLPGGGVLFKGLGSLCACALAMFSTLPLLIIYYKGGQTVEAPEVKQTQQSISDKPKTIEDENWERASVDDLYSGEYELDS